MLLLKKHTVHQMFAYMAVFTRLLVNVACIALHKDIQSNPVPIEVKTC